MSTKYEWINAIVINEIRQSISHVHHNICFSLFLLDLFRYVMFYRRSRHQCHCYQRKSINSFFKKVFFFYFSLIWNKNCSKCNSKTFHDLNLPQPSHPSTWLCRIEISEKKSLCIGLHKNGNILHRFYSLYSTATRKKWTIGCAVFFKKHFSVRKGQVNGKLYLN